MERPRLREGCLPLSLGLFELVPNYLLLRRSMLRVVGSPETIVRYPTIRSRPSLPSSLLLFATTAFFSYLFVSSRAHVSRPHFTNLPRGSRHRPPRSLLLPFPRAIRPPIFFRLAIRSLFSLLPPSLHYILFFLTYYPLPVSAIRCPTECTFGAATLFFSFAPALPRLLHTGTVHCRDACAGRVRWLGHRRYLGTSSPEPALPFNGEQHNKRWGMRRRSRRRVVLQCPRSRWLIAPVAYGFTVFDEYFSSVRTTIA